MSNENQKIPQITNISITSNDEYLCNSIKNSGDVIDILEQVVKEFKSKINTNNYISIEKNKLFISMNFKEMKNNKNQINLFNK